MAGAVSALEEVTNGVLNVLIVSWYFPPINEIGAVRVGKFAEHLIDSGEQAWVITAQREDPDNSLTTSVPSDHIIRTSWLDVDQMSSPWMWFRARRRSERPSDSAASMAGGLHLRSELTHQYAALVRLPDRQVGWLPYLLRDGTMLLRKQKIDLILASGPPFTTFMGASILSRRFHVPWVAEYRDGWSRYLYSPKPKWREAIDERMERRITSSASGIVALSEPWANFYGKRFGKPTAAIYNGYDAEALAPATSRKPEKDAPVSIVYMGALYQGLRDPQVLYKALVESGLKPTDVEISYYGPTASEIMPHAERLGVGAFVKIHDRVSYKRALEIQRESDVLLLLQSPLDPKNVPAKTFEYFAAQRPILGLGLDEGIPAKLVSERNAGLYRTNASAVADQLQKWVAEKRSMGYVAGIPDKAHEGLSRTAQFDCMVTFLNEISDQNPAPRFHIADSSHAASSMFPSGPSAIVDYPSATPPQLLVVIDAEEEFDWGRPFSSKETGVSTMSCQYMAQLLFARFGVIPTYAVDYPVANQPDGYLPLRDFLQDGACEIGAQLHPWVTPPHEEEVCERNSFPGNLSVKLEYEKLKSLTAAIESNLGVRPRLYRAGRYGTGPNTAQIISDLGYKIDCSVLPDGLKSSNFATDYRGAPVKPYWIGADSNLLEIPVTTSAVGIIPRASPAVAKSLSMPVVNRLRITPVLARLRILDRIRLSPEGNTLQEAKRLTRFLAANGHKVFVVSYHSPSLGIGHTPYVKTKAELDRFLHWLEAYMEFFFTEMGGAPSTPNRIFEWSAALKSGATTPIQ